MKLYLTSFDSNVVQILCKRNKMQGSNVNHISNYVILVDITKQKEIDKINFNNSYIYNKTKNR